MLISYSPEMKYVYTYVVHELGLHFAQAGTQTAMFNPPTTLKESTERNWNKSNGTVTTNQADVTQVIQLRLNMTVSSI